jgi:conjugative relaxase-like TrwC/TraI family protein
VSGYDLTFAAPKSVSLLHLLASSEIAGAVGAGHRVAVAEAADYLERNALGVRRTQSGARVKLPTTGLVAGEFVHRTSRALDPHLHTHLVVANVAEGVDGRWSAVEGRRFFAHARATQGIYHARLRMELRDRLGASWVVPRSGLGDVLGVDPKLRRLFSQRQAAIEEYSDRRGTGPPGRNRTRGAFYATREEKDRTRSVGSLIEEWRGRASDFGFDLGDLSKVVGLGRARAPVGEIDPARVRQHLEDLPDRCRSLARRDLVAIVAVAAPGGSSARAIESIATRVMESAGAPLGAEYSVNGSRGSSETAAGQSVSLLEPRWSTEEVVRAMGRGADRLLNPVDAQARSVADLAWSGERGREERERMVPRIRTVGVDRGSVDLGLGR